ncbi:SIS domain-containing protein [Subtercola sp. Z020]|uniref:SIS domain-containing protein n=1 Tax=Subtercola sp. Z020 TaxID=2080582 RepID=UPI00130E2D12|nr:SIS domain-containing protein [Subtercola sp. Z020]
MKFPSLFEHVPATISEISSRTIPAAAVEIVRRASAVRFVAMGGSYNAASAAVEAFLARDVDARAELASHLLHVESVTAKHSEAIVFISQSGTSVETIRAAERLRALGYSNLICITNNVDSDLARACDVVIDQALTKQMRVPFGPWIATYTTLVRLAGLRAGQPEADWDSAAEAARSALGQLHEVVALAPVAPAYVEFFGRGAFRATAEQGTLIVREIARVPASAWDSSTYRHGPIEAISPSQLSIVFAASQGRAAQLDRAFAAALREIVSDVIVVGPEDADVPIRADDEIAALVSILAAAFLAYTWGESAGLTIGEFRYTSHSVTDEDTLVLGN